jgi:hypothetical protein
VTQEREPDSGPVCTEGALGIPVHSCAGIFVVGMSRRADRDCALFCTKSRALPHVRMKYKEG